MKTTRCIVSGILVAAFSLILGSHPSIAAESVPAPEPAQTNKTKAAPQGTATTLEINGEEAAGALRRIARQAGLNLFVSDKVTGTLTMRMENTTPREAITIICKAKDLALFEDQGNIFVKTIPERNEEETLKWEAERRAIYLSTLYKSLIEKGVPDETARDILKTSPIPDTPKR